jgi:hypothetical protein
VFTVGQVDRAGIERRGRGKYVSIRRHRQDNRVDGESTVYFTEQIVALLRVQATHRRQLRQKGEQGFGCVGNLLLLGGEALNHEQSTPPRILDLALALVQAGCHDDRNRGHEDNQQQHMQLFPDRPGGHDSLSIC